jgi:hypothetical protein
LIGVPGQPINFDLGPDKILCDQPSYVISTGLSDPGFIFQWSNGMATSSVSVSATGKYVVKVSGNCSSFKDSVNVTFRKKPVPFTLGESKTLCEFKPVSLASLNDTTGFKITWQDGSQGATFVASTFGTYWVTVKNECGQVSDTVKYSQVKADISKIPNVITPNGDGKNDYFKIDPIMVGEASLRIVKRWGKEVYWSPQYFNDWDGGNLDPGVYFLLLSSGCVGHFKDTLTIIR